MASGRLGEMLTWRLEALVLVGYLVLNIQGYTLATTILNFLRSISKHKRSPQWQ